MTELAKTQADAIDTLKQSYENYNDLVQRILNLADKDYVSVRDLKVAMMTTLSESLHEAGLKKEVK